MSYGMIQTVFLPHNLSYFCKNDAHHRLKGRATSLFIRAFGGMAYGGGSKREEWSGFRAKSEQSARSVSTSTDIPGENRFSSGILLLKGVNDVFCRATD